MLIKSPTVYNKRFSRY